MIALVLLVLNVAFTATSVHADASADAVSRGAYIFTAAGCRDCHGASGPGYLAGGTRLATKLSVFDMTFYTPNITPDPETGIGKWTLKDFRRALREGRSPTGMYYYPVFPYRSYTKLSDSDIADMWAYLRSVPPVEKENRNHVLDFPFDDRQSTGNNLLTSLLSTRTGIAAWQMGTAAAPFASVQERIRIGFGAMPNDPERSGGWNRGAYLVEAAFHCAECHSPRVAVSGILKLNQWMSGANFKLNGHSVPNITPDVRTGLGRWSAEDWDTFLRTGYKPGPQGQLQSIGYEMADVIQNTANLTPKDRAAVIEYLMNLPPVRSLHED